MGRQKGVSWEVRGWWSEMERLKMEIMDGCRNWRFKGMRMGVGDSQNHLP